MKRRIGLKDFFNLTVCVYALLATNLVIRKKQCRNEVKNGYIVIMD